MTIKEIYRHYLQQLQVIYSLGEATVISDRVFESVAAIQRADIIKTPDLIPEQSIATKLNDCLKELLQHKPLQYVTGEAWFYNMKLLVNEHVLIPRPETEELVKLILNEYHNLSENENGSLNILDIGTGSGCIAIALKKNLPAAKVTAIDISSSALMVGKKNAIDQQVTINFREFNFLHEYDWKQLSQYDIIVSNPPYIPENELVKMDKNVTGFEPHTALFVPDHSPLLFYEKIAAFGKTNLAPGGKIFMEIHEDFGEQTAALFTPFYEATIINDMFGKQRMITAKAFSF
ncbi:MAG: peptide chain release factor N(5)-glutamine methyltransferase [Ferruginibacter sp.]